MLRNTELPTTAITEAPPPMSPTIYASICAWGEVLGVLLIAGTVLAKDFISRRDIGAKKKEEEEDGIIEILKAEINKRDELIAHLNELMLTRKTMDFSGEFPPPVLLERILEVNSREHSNLYDRENNQLLQKEGL